jgi:hypothetical protein
VTGSCEHGNAPSGPIEGGEFFDREFLHQVRDY